MKIFPGIIVAFLVAILISSGCIQSGYPVLQETARDNHDAVAELGSGYLHTYGTMRDFSANLTMTSPFGITCEKIRFAQPDKYRIDYTCPKDNGYNFTVFDGDALWSVKNFPKEEIFMLPAESLNLAFTDEFDTSGIDTLMTVRTILETSTNRSKTITLTKNTAAIFLNVSNISPPVYLPGHRFGDISFAHLVFGEQNSTIRSVTFFDNSQREILSIDYSDVKINSGLSNNTFSFVPHANSAIQPVPTLIITPIYIGSVNQAREAHDKGYFGEMFLPGYIPAGYQFSQGSSLPCRWTSFLYSNDGSTLRIDEWVSVVAGKTRYWYSYQIPKPENATPVRMNGMTGYYLESGSENQLRWISGNISYQVSGPVNKSELVRIAESIA
ncbi:MAG: DUF4367 domain-containing protein [Methanoregula sp.]|jgi:outer membrane lipoprotein-sorting protein